MTNSNRYGLLDGLRGFAFINMIIYHMLWDMVFIFDTKIPWFTSLPAYVWQQLICSAFILISGFCFSLGKKQLKRGLILILASFIISLVTIIAMPNDKILFGILCLLGSASLLMIPLDKILKKPNPYTGLIISFILFGITKNIYYREIGFFNLTFYNMPSLIYRNHITAYFGFPPLKFESSDYFPIIPWLFLYICGYFIYRIFKRKNWLKALNYSLGKPLEWLGQHSLIIYMLHQPIIYTVLALIYKLF